MYPELQEVRALAETGEYRRIPVCRQLYADRFTPVTAEPDSRLFSGMVSPFPVARYHSLAAEEESLPPQLHVTARTMDGEVMAVAHMSAPVYGLQFHPESILTPDGRRILENFLALLLSIKMLLYCLIWFSVKRNSSSKSYSSANLHAVVNNSLRRAFNCSIAVISSSSNSSSLEAVTLAFSFR